MTISPREGITNTTRERKDYTFENKVKRTMSSIFTEKRYMQKYRKFKRNTQRNDANADESGEDTDDSFSLDFLEASDGEVSDLRNKKKWKKLRLLKCLKNLDGSSSPNDIKKDFEDFKKERLEEEVLELPNVEKEISSEENPEVTEDIKSKSRQRINKWKWNAKLNLKVSIDYKIDATFLQYIFVKKVHHYIIIQTP